MAMCSDRIGQTYPWTYFGSRKIIKWKRDQDHFTPLEIMPRCSLRARGSLSRRPSGPGSAPEGLMPRREALSPSWRALQPEADPKAMGS